MKLRFHWMLPKGGEVDIHEHQTPVDAARYRTSAFDATSPASQCDIRGWTQFSHAAEEAGIDSVLIALNRYEPDPLVVSCALGSVVDKLKFICAYRAGLILPTSFVQQVNTLSAFLPGRIALNIVAGSSTEEQFGYGDFLSHDERYARAAEFLTVCRMFWNGHESVNFKGNYYQLEDGKLHTHFVASDRSFPEIYISGHSIAAEALAVEKGTCLLRVADDPQKLRPVVARMSELGLEVCLRMCIVCRPSRAEAIDVVNSLVPRGFAVQTRVNSQRNNDSSMFAEVRQSPTKDSDWINPSLWRGLARCHGPVWTTLLGTPSEIAAAFLEYKQIGVSQFILSGWPELSEVRKFGKEILPLIREEEH